MPTQSPNAIPRPRTSAGTRPAIPALLLLLAAFLFPAPAVDGAVVAGHSASMMIANEADFPDRVFVVGPVKRVDGKERPVLDPAKAQVVSAETPPLLTREGGDLVVLAVPRVLADKTKGEPDASWFESDPPGVVRVSGSPFSGALYRPVVLRYQVEKNDAGLHLKLLNPEELEAASRMPADTSALPPPPKPLLPWLLAGGGLVLLAGVVGVWLLRRKEPASAG